MSQGFEFQYALDFVNDFDAAVLSNSSIPEKGDAVFQQQVQDVVGNVKLILGLHPGVTTMSTYLEYNGSRYRITLSHN